MEKVEAVEITTEAVEVTTEAVEITTEAVEITTEAVEIPTEAVEITTEAVEIPTEAVEITTEAVEITTSVASFLENTHRPLAALKFFKESLTLLELIEQEINSCKASVNLETQRALNKRTIFVLLSIADTNLTLERYKESKIHAELALAKSRKIGCKETEGECQRTLGLCLVFDRSQHDQSIEYFKEMLEATKESGDAETEAIAYHLLAMRHMNVGELEEAARFLEKSIQTSRKSRFKKIEFESLITLAHVFFRDHEEKALRKLTEALQICDEIESDEKKAKALVSLGDLFMFQESYEESKECFEKAMQLHTKVPYFGLSVYLRLGIVLRILEQFDEAIKCLHRGLDICGKNNLEDHYLDYKDLIYSQLCHLHLLLREPDKANEYVTKILTGSWHEYKYDCLGLLGVCIGKYGHFEQACDILAESIKGYEHNRDLFNDEAKLSFEESIVDGQMYSHRCTFLVALGKFAEALCTAERGRAYVLTQLLAKRYGIQEKPNFSETDLNGLMGSLAKRQILLFVGSGLKYEFLWIMTNEKGLNFKEMSGEKAKIDCLLKAYIRSLFCGRSVNCEDRSLSALYDIHSPADGAQHDRIREKRLFQDSDVEELEAENLPNQLYNSLIAPIADRIQGREVVLAPEGSMVMVPFVALQEDSGKYLSDSCSIRIIPSLSTLKLILDSSQNYHSQTGALIVGDPQVSHVTRLKQLKAARQEAKEVAALLEVEPLLGKQATKEEVLRRITDVCLIHIAAHGDAERGEIACAPNPSSPQEPSKEDYMLTMGDIANVRIRAKLVVLSCCHSAKGKIMQAEGVVGIARAFIASGARSVLVSLWAVDDKATKEFMIRFYGHLKCDKMSASEALHHTMKWMRESKTARYTVREWAPFVLIGDNVNLDL
ncbi:uncharacterized protein LOC111325823 [Stylophora pistillata]|nr:uncharacterized protein LOC111325823 [Stylophora pistillata]XP_022785474.1 uncharacterized protein LOC111325823 [Stylophora pistillata]